MLPAFDIRLDNPVKGKEYLSIGDDCIVSGKFILNQRKVRFLSEIIHI